MRDQAQHARPGAKDRLDWALAILLKATRTNNRQASLLDTAEALDIAHKSLGGLQEVSHRVGISKEMLREFSSVKKLCMAVKRMLRKGLITSVDVAYRLSMLKAEEQVIVAKEYTSGHLSSREVRDVVSFYKKYKGRTILYAIRRVRGSRGVRLHLVKFRIPPEGPRLAFLRRRFEKIAGRGSIVSIRTRMGTATLVLTKEGRDRLQRLALERKMTAANLIEELVGGR